MWESPPDWVSKFFAEELEARVPRSILECKEISREVNFTSAEKMVHGATHVQTALVWDVTHVPRLHVELHGSMWSRVAAGRMRGNGPYQ